MCLNRMSMSQVESLMCSWRSLIFKEGPWLAREVPDPFLAHWCATKVHSWEGPYWSLIFFVLGTLINKITFAPPWPDIIFGVNYLFSWLRSVAILPISCLFPFHCNVNFFLLPFITIGLVHLNHERIPSVVGDIVNHELIPSIVGDIVGWGDFSIHSELLLHVLPLHIVIFMKLALLLHNAGHHHAIV